MSAAGRAAVSRADMLRILTTGGELALEKMAFTLGYQRIPSEPPNESKIYTIEAAIEVNTALPIRVINRPDQLPTATFLYVAERKRLQQHDQTVKTEIPEWMNQAELLTDDICLNKETFSLPVYAPLIRWPRLWPFLRKVLGQSYASRQPDIPRLIADFAKGQTIRRLPMATQHGWSEKVCILLDFQLQTQSYSHDFNQLWIKLKKLHGRLGLDVRILEGDAGLQTRYRKPNNDEVLPWKMPSVGIPLLILSDLGLLAESVQQRQGWERFGHRLRGAGCRPRVLSPIPASLQDKTLQQIYTIHSWDRNSRLQANKGSTIEPSQEAAVKQTSGVETLLVLLSTAIVIEPGLLRAVRHILPARYVDVADEAGFWQHPDISSSTQGCCYKTLSAVSKYQHRLDEADFWQAINLQGLAENNQLKQHLVSLIQQHHMYLPQSVRMMEMDLCDRLLPDIVEENVKSEIKKWKQAMAKTCYNNEHHLSLQSWNQQYIASLPAIMLNNPQIAALWALAQRPKLKNGEIIHYPEAIDKQQIAFILSGESADTHSECRLFQLGNELRIAEKASYNKPPGSFITDLLLDGDLAIKTELDNGHAIESHWQWQNSTESFCLGNSKQIGEVGLTIRQLSLTNEGEILVLKSLSKPDWASLIGRDAEGLWLEFEQQGKLWRVYWPAWGGELGYDQYGLYNDLNIKGVIQRSRFIPPGTFLMGSPSTEQQRQKSEIQHQVTLTQGYWLADTACTQALWQAVMDENPAHFNEDENHPVEQVGWDNVQEFLQKLNSLIPGLAAKLPTEAQWEYACRAGTITPFSFGDNITPELVNYHGEYPYAGGKEGLYREKTAPVKSLPANPWGLYEMHGNIWEWCQDWYDDYSETAVANPTGAETGIFRVLRGGSWINGGRDSRSAGRYWDEPDFRNGSIGFRFAPGQAGNQEAEPVVAASERGKQSKTEKSFFEKLAEKVLPKK